MMSSSKKFSKKINYDAIDNIFAGSPSTAPKFDNVEGDEDEKEDDEDFDEKMDLIGDEEKEDDVDPATKQLRSLAGGRDENEGDYDDYGYEQEV